LHNHYLLLYSDFLHRRDLLKSSLSLIAAPMINAGRCRLFASQSHGYSVRAIDLVAQSNVIDMLGLLTLDWPLLDRWRNSPESFREAEFAKLRGSGIDVFHPAVAFEVDRPYDITRQWLEHWNLLLAEHPQYFVRVGGPADLLRAKQERKLGVILGMQDANYIRTVDDVAAFYGLGQRVMQLTYNSTNQLGCGCKVKDGGLTPFGQSIIGKMNALGMAIDVSHCGERTTLDAIAASKNPVLITHSNCRALAPHVARCKSDAVIRAAAKAGSVIGLTSVRRFIRASDPVTVEDALDHFDHVTKVAGIEHAGIGSDSDLQGNDAKCIADLNHPRRMYDLTEGLIRRGYTNRHIELILGGNFQRVLSEIWV
jgi:membrane dipeptidase